MGSNNGVLYGFTLTDLGTRLEALDALKATLSRPEGGKSVGYAA